MKTPPIYHFLRCLTFITVGCMLIVTSPAAKADPANSAPAPEPQAASSLAGKWRTTGTFRLYVNGTLGMGGDAPAWLSFQNDGSIIADGERWLVGWRNSGGHPQLALNTKVIRRELGEPSSIRYVRNSLSVSGKSINGNYECIFRVRGVDVRFIWKFSGSRRA